MINFTISYDVKGFFWRKNPIKRIFGTLFIKFSLRGKKVIYLIWFIIVDIGDLFFDDFSLEFSKEIKNRLRICGIGDKRVLKIEIELKNLMTTSKLRKIPKKLQKGSRIWGKNTWSNISQIHNKLQLISFKFQNTWSHLEKKSFNFLNYVHQIQTFNLIFIQISQSKSNFTWI